jgi:phage terminase large subunit-like protein
VEFCRVFGVELLPWQVEVGEQWLEHDAGALTRPTCALVVPRRNGKSMLLVMRILFGMYALGERRVSFSAQDHRTSGEIFSLMADLIEDNVPELMANKRLANGQQRLEIRTHDGRVSRFTPSTRTASGGRGLECDLLVMDEGMYLVPSHMAALTPLVAKSRNAGRGQVLIASSAGTVESEVLRQLRDRGREASGTSGAGFAYHEWASADDADPASVKAWKAANPSLGTALLDESFLSSQRLLNSPEGFAREHLGAWGESGDLPAIDPVAWNACHAHKLHPIYEGAPLWFTFDIAFNRQEAVLLCFQQLESGQVEMRTLEAVASPNGISEAGFRDLIQKHAQDLAPESIGYDELSGGSIAKDLEQEFTLTRLPVRKYSVACQLLKHAVGEARLVHDGDPLVAMNLARAVPKRYSDGGWIFDRGKADIPAATAAAIGFYLASDPDVSDTTIHVAS